jgi:hypothetical protein
MVHGSVFCIAFVISMMLVVYSIPNSKSEYMESNLTLDTIQAKVSLVQIRHQTLSYD